MANTKECEACDGTGTVQVDDYDRRGEHVSRSVVCPECSGDRYVDDADDEFCADDDRPASLNAEVAWEVQP